MADKFDSLLNSLGLPKNAEKDQNPAFQTIWYGILYYSKMATYSIPPAKWENIRNFCGKHFIDIDTDCVKTCIGAAELLSGLEKFHHITLV